MVLCACAFRQRRKYRTRINSAGGRLVWEKLKVFFKLHLRLIWDRNKFCGFNDIGFANDITS